MWVTAAPRKGRTEAGTEAVLTAQWRGRMSGPGSAVWMGGAPGAGGAAEETGGGEPKMWVGRERGRRMEACGGRRGVRGRGGGSEGVVGGRGGAMGSHGRAVGGG